MPSTLDGVQIIKPMHENVAMDKKNETRTFPKHTKHSDEIEEIRKKLSELPEIAIEPPE